MRRFAIVASLVLGIVLLLGAGLLYPKLVSHGFSAREDPWAIEAFVARRLRRLAVGSEAKAMANPLSATPAMLAEARDHFADHCATCHANDGSGETAINDGLYPPAPDLRDAQTQDLTDGELLYIIRTGLGFTGMPGWGGEDEENWKLVLFIRHQPRLSHEELDLMGEINPEEPKEGGHAH